MATIAIDQTDVRAPAVAAAAPARKALGSRTALVVGGVVLGIAAIGGTAAAIVSHLTLPNSLSGLAFLPKPEAPRRSEIRMGRLPDMPEIRDGVPAVIGTKAAPRIVETSPPVPGPTGPKQVAVIPVPAAALARAPLPNAFTSAAATQLATPMTQVDGPARVDTVALTSSIPPGPSRSLGAPSPSASLVAPAPAREAPFQPAPKAEPVSTASVPASAFVPLPPPAPARSLARAPEGRPEKPAKPAQVAARQPAQPVAPPPADAAATPAADDRMEVLGVKLPNGSDLKNAVSSIGEALNLPKAF